jgi:hypothetical protein
MTSALDVSRPPVRQRLANTLGGGPSPARVRVALLVIVLAFVALGSVIAIKTPAWESSDEPGHVLNIETLARGHWYGIDLNCPATPQTTILSCNGDEPQQAPLYYMLMAGWQRLVGLQVEPPPTNQLDLTSDKAREEFFLHHPDHGFLIWLRLPNVILGAATVLMAFFATRLATRDIWTPVIAAALVAFLPGFVFHSAFVTNDNLVNLLGAVLTFCALRFIRDLSSGWIIATGVVYGFLLTTKLSVVPLALIVPFLALMAPTWRRRLVLFAYGALSALVVSAWYLIQNWVRYGDPLARHATITYLIRDGALGLPDGVHYVVKDPLDLIVFNVPNKIASNVWYSSGWGQFHWPQSLGYLITFVVLVLLLGLINRGISNQVLLVLGAIALLSLACVWLLAFQTAAYGARFAYVGIAAIAALVALALQRWPLAIRWLLPAAGVVGCLVAIHQDVLSVHWT